MRKKITKVILTQADPKRAQDLQIYFCDSPTGLSIVDRQDISKEKRDAILKLQRLEIKNNTKFLTMLRQLYTVK